MDHPIRRYLEDAIAAEKSFEKQLNTFAEEATSPRARTLFEQHAAETHQQYVELTSRLNALGGSTSVLKGFLATLFNTAPRTAQLGHDETERTTQDLIMAFAVENAEVAMYEALTVAAETVGDSETATLARRIQAQEKATADKLWPLIGATAQEGFEQAESKDGARDVMLRYLQDAEAAEENFEDALATFSKSGDQEEVRSLMSLMSNKAKEQHTRLRARITSLGAERSTSKSLLAHLLAFTPVTAQMGHSESEKSTQHLMITYSAAAAEMGMYEALAAAASAAGDGETERLARQLQSDEQEDHTLAWQNLPQSARMSAQAVLAHR